MVFWVAAPCSVVVGYCFRGSCCLHLQGWSVVNRTWRCR